MKKHFSFILFLLFAFQIIEAQCNMSIADSMELVNFYNNLNGEDWGLTEGLWLEGPVEGWEGIYLTEIEDSCYVELIQFVNTIDVGDAILHDINLPYLITLKITGAGLNGEIPNFDNLPNLIDLRLNNNNLSSDIPNFNNFNNLEILWLHNNSLSGNIPNFENLQMLNELLISNNNLSGSIPNFDNLTNLNTLNLGVNNLSGNIPNFDNLTSLEYLQLGINNLSGSIPNFDNLPNLISLKLSENNLSGSIPNFDNLPNLITLDVQINNLEGSVPNFDNLPNLERLYLNDNHLSGMIPDFTLLPNLYDFIVCPGNDFYGAIPSLLSTSITEYPDFECIYNADLTGYAYWDTDSNCVYNEGELPIINAFVAIDNGYYVMTDLNGYYNLGADTGLHVIDYYPGNLIFQQRQDCDPVSYIVEVDSLSQTITDLNFANKALVECPYLMVNMASPPILECSNTTYTLSYCNGGTSLAEEAYIELELSPNLSFEESSLMTYTLNNDTLGNEMLSFDLGDIEPSTCDTFTVNVSVACDLLEGQGICSNATIYPHEPCTDTLSWDGSDLSVEAYCEEDSILFRIRNIGEDMDSEGNWRIWGDDILIAWDDIILSAGDSLDVKTVTNGDTYRMVLEQSAGHPSLSSPQVIVEGCGGFPFSTGYVTSQMQADENPYVEIECQEIGPDLPGFTTDFSRDNEQKLGLLAYPKGMREEHYVPLGAEIEYIVWFEIPNENDDENTIDIMVIDTLDNDRLDILSLQTAVSSHPYEVQIRNGNVLIFDLYEVPLSSDNISLDVGYIKFKIRLKEEYQDNSTLYNKADVYFNLVEPIPTNTHFHHVNEEAFALTDSTKVEPVSVSSLKRQSSKLFPNPCDQSCSLQIDSKYPFNEAYQILIKDIYGIKRGHYSLNHAKQSINTQKLNQGIYFYQVLDQDGRGISEGKLVVQH